MLLAASSYDDSEKQWVQLRYENIRKYHNENIEIQANSYNVEGVCIDVGIDSICLDKGSWISQETVLGEVITYCLKRPTWFYFKDINIIFVGEKDGK